MPSTIIDTAALFEKAVEAANGKGVQCDGEMAGAAPSQGHLPTLLLWGAEDHIATPAYGEGWRQAIPGARLEIIPQAGHFPHWEQPEAFVEHLSAFVDKSG